MSEIPKECWTCYHHHHKNNDNIKCNHTLMCHEHDKWIPCTNGDFLRMMSDGKLGKWMCDHNRCNTDCVGMAMCGNGNNGIVKWLGETLKPNDFY